ncbi:MAG: sulfotransferase [Vannielia sp.]|uniref:tetratricopeptide repeat-containing sulfotransferase family protein n=1 Tax=Vannielia sp. TaxID=2813045 RepID=UPI003B8D82ED
MAQVSPQIKTHFAEAQQAQASGRYDVAKALYTKILRLNERLPEVHFHLGRLEMQRGAPKKAIKPLRRALELKPTEPMVWRLLLDALIASGDSSGADTLVRAAQSAPLPPQTARELAIKARTGNRSGEAQLGGADPVAFQQAVQLFESGQHAEAAQAAEALHHRHPAVAPILAVLGAARAALGEIDAAEFAYREAIARDDSYAEAHLQLGQLLYGRGSYESATVPLERANELTPDNPLVARFLGLTAVERERYAMALPLLEKAAKALPDDTSLTFGHARALHLLGRHDEARTLVAPLADAPDAPPGHLCLMGEILTSLEEQEAARAHFDRALATRPGFGPAISGLAWIAQQQGNFDLSAEYFTQASAGGTIDGRLARTYSAGRKMLADDPLLPQMQAAFDEGTELPGSRADLTFALAKAAEDQGKTAEAFEKISLANALLNERFPIRSRMVRDLYQRGTTTWNAALTPVAPQDGPRMVFVTGMPRSGTTLVEQIISSHSTVTGGGEIGLLSRALGDRQRLAMAEERSVSPSQLQAAAGEVAEQATALASGAPVLTDKAILTSSNAGFVPLVCPGSRLIVVRRDPRDNCLSMFKNRFRDGTHRYTTDLEELAHNYLAHLEGLAFWRKHTPDAFLEVRYENLIADPEAGARALVDYAGLEWEDACLRFYENTRTVKTLSAFQVRQPIYSSSVGAWRKFEKELTPLIDILRKGGALEEWEA